MPGVQPATPTVLSLEIRFTRGLGRLLQGFALLLTFSGAALADSPAALTRGRYLVLTADPDGPAPFAAVEFTYGPAGVADGVAWQLTVHRDAAADAPPLMALRAVTARDPLSDSAESPVFRSYRLRIPETGEAYEYVNVHTNGPLLPAWRDFVKFFVPRPARAARRQAGFPNTCDYLGHVLTLQRTDAKAEWPEWQGLQTLRLDPELLIGTGRNFKDSEGHRLPQKPQRQNYTYVPFTQEDYRVMIEAGVNLFTIAPEQEPFVRGEPVFYLRGKVDGRPPLRYPADLYRSNYVGATMFMDEPTILLIGDRNVHNTLRYFSDAANLIARRVEARYLDDGVYGAFHLERLLRQHKVSFGAMRLAQTDYPAWETVYETAYYQLAGGLAGFVHEGRYELEGFNRLARASSGLERRYSAEEMFKFIYAQMRGPARRFGKDWGTSIYGQADPRLSPLALSMAYDRGARYLWFWTSDHEHHLPWPEQLELTRAVRRHAAGHPRGSIRAGQPTLDKVIVIPYGYFLTLEPEPGRERGLPLWWVRELDEQRKNEASQRYRRLLARVFAEVNRALDAGQEFDITMDDGMELNGYREVIRVSDD